MIVYGRFGRAGGNGVVMDARTGREALKQLEGLWRRKAAGRPMPQRAEFDFRDFMPWIGHIRIVKVSPSPPRLEVTLDGAEIVNVAGIDLTGKHLDVVYGSDRLKFLLDGYSRVLAGEGAVYEVLRPNDRIVNFGEIVRVLLPCGVENTIQHILYCEYAYDVLHWGATVFADMDDLRL